ncbi:MAG: hypothetical protein ACYTBY_09685 [Planctomycetota bacterium]
MVLLYLGADCATLGGLDTPWAEITVGALVQTHQDQQAHPSIRASSCANGNGDLTDPIYPKRVCH